eukprot:s9229_g1.t1
MPLYEGDSYKGMVLVMVTGVVADVGHNILSTEHMVATGWEVKFSKAEISLRRVKGGLVGYGQSWAGCVTQHRRGKDVGNRPVELQADFCFINLVHDPSDTLAPPILKELDDGIPSEVQGEVDKAFEGKVSQGPTTDMSQDAGVPVVSAPSLKRPKTSHGSTDLEGEEPSAASKPDVIDVEMFEDPSIPYENIADEEMHPGYFEDEQPMEVEKEVIDGTEPMSVESQEVPSQPSRVPRLLEALHPRLDAPEGFTNAVGELEAPKLAKVVNAVLIEKN